VVSRDGELKIMGEAEPVLFAIKTIEGLLSLSARGETIGEQNVRYILRLVRSGNEARIGELAADVVCVTAKGKPIKAKTIGQKKYVDAIKNNVVTLAIGPAGTGKTYLAVAVAVSMLKKRQIRRIVLARPAVEAGEKLGFLPGDIQAKVNPYLRPLFDALEDMMDFAQMRKFMDLDIIEIIPLAFMRGRTLNEAAIICDEAQNTSGLQMLMVLTRLGHGSKMIITGDVTQIDLDIAQKSGMIEAMETLRRIKGIGVVELNQRDIVRHRLVQNIVRAYKKKQESQKQGQTRRRS